MPTIIAMSDINPEDLRARGIHSLDCPDLSDHEAFDQIAAVNRSLSAHAESLDHWLAGEGGPDEPYKFSRDDDHDPVPPNRRIGRGRLAA